MTLTLREVLARQANDTISTGLDTDELVGLGEKRLRRRRIGAAAGGAAAAVVALALALAVGYNGPVNRGNGPVNHPKPSPDETRHEPARKVVYADHLGRDERIHWGRRAVDTGGARVHMDVTDDGFAYTTEDGRLWFSAGGAPEQIGSNVCGRSGYPHNIGAFEQDSVISGNSGSEVVWFECPQVRGATLVVFDTSSDREVARQRVARCVRVTAVCSLRGVIGNHVYFERPIELVSFDITTGRQTPATPQSYVADIRSRPRGLVIGDSWRTGTATNGIDQSFHVVGSRLVPVRAELNGVDTTKEVPTRAFDTGTGADLRFHLPEGYHPNTDHLPVGVDPLQGFTIFEWLDDDTVALVQGGGESAGRIITCRISDGRCARAVTPPSRGEVRVVPHQILPG